MRETGDSFPETSLLVPLADILECSVDELLRGRFSSGSPSAQNGSPSGFDEERTEVLCGAEGKKQDRPLKLWQALCIAIGVALVLFGIVAMLVISMLGGETERSELIGLVFFFVFLSVAVFLLVFSGMSYGVTDAVDETERKNAAGLTLSMSTAIAVILLSIIAAIIQPLGVYSEVAAVAIMLSVMAVCVAVIVFTGIGISRLHIPEGSRDDSPWEGIIMMAATLIFLLCGFLGDYWHPAWVAFPIGGILCGIVCKIGDMLKK